MSDPKFQYNYQRKSDSGKVGSLGYVYRFASSSSRITSDVEIPGLKQDQFSAIVIDAVSLPGWELSAVTDTSVSIAIRESGSVGTIELFVVDSRIFISTDCDPVQDPVQWHRKYAAMIIERFVTMMMEHHPDHLENESLVVEEPERKPQDNNLWDSIRPRSNFLITPLIILVNLFIFFTMVASGADVIEPDSRIMVAWGANYQRLTLSDEPWRLLSSCFLHFGISHLLVNLYALLFIGMMLEPKIGKARFLIAYIITGIAGSLNSQAWHPFSVSAGASGAIFGMYGLFLALLTAGVIERTYRKRLLVSIAIFIVFSLFSGVSGNTDNAAHIGGLVAGLVTGYLLVPSLKPNRNLLRKTFTLLVVSVLSGLIFYKSYQMIPPTAVQYDKTMKLFQHTETTALEVFQLPADTTRAVRLDAIDKGIDNWKRNLETLRALESQSFPEGMQERHRLLKEYTELRLAYYNLMRRSLLESPERYSAKMARIGQEIVEYTRLLRGE